MPWSASEAKGHTKSADTPEKQRKWAKIANSALSNARSNKKSDPEGYAIRVANSAMGDHYWIGDVFDDALWMSRRDTWSPEAREASIQARKGHGEGGPEIRSKSHHVASGMAKKRKKSRFEEKYHAGET